jgi:hypothetical protein
MLETSRDYHELNAGAHRKPPKVLSAPSLIWHLAFWTSFGGRHREGQWQKKNPNHVKNTLDNFILAFCRAVDNNPGVEQKVVDGKAIKVQLTPRISGVCLLFNNTCRENSFEITLNRLNRRQTDVFTSTSRSVSLQFTWKKLDVTVRFEIHSEYFSISTFVELDKDRKKAEEHTAYSDIDGLNESIRTIVGYLNPPQPPTLDPESLLKLAVGKPASQQLADESSPQQLQQPKNELPPPAPDDHMTKKINNYCFHEFWKTYEKDVLSDESLKDFTNDGIFKQIFADFRGFIASERAVEFSDKNFFDEDKPPKWGLEAKKKFLPLIQHRDRTLHRRYECAVNYLLDGRALYMSTLGPQLPSMPETERIPVEFIVYAHQRYDDATVVNKWQLGRLVNQILLLGTLRLCALKDVKLLHKAGRQLGELDESTQAARVAIALTEAQASASRAAGPNQDRSTVSNAGRRAVRAVPKTPASNETPTGGPPSVSHNVKAMELIAAAHNKLNNINGHFLRDSGSGLLYRIERSRYYVKQFDESLKLLRIKRVEGDQPYDQFIKRRLGSEFDFIDRVGVRYERATRNIVTLDQNYLAITQNALVERANQIDEDIHAIQKYGELFLLGALVPYYVTHLFVLIFGEELAPVIAGNVWVVFAVFAVANFFKVLEKIGKLMVKILRNIWTLVPLLGAARTAISEMWRSFLQRHPNVGTAVALFFLATLALTAVLEGPQYEDWLREKKQKNQDHSMSEISTRILDAQRNLKKSVDDGNVVLEQILKVQRQSLEGPKAAPPVEKEGD